MFSKSLFSIVFFSILVTASAFAETMFVTDSFKITLRTGPSNENKVIAMLKSNEELEVLEKGEDWVNVRLKNGKEGYVLRRFLTSEIPKFSVIIGLQEKVEKLKNEVSSLGKSKERLEKSNLELESSLFSREKELTKVKRDYEELKSGAAGYIEVKELKDNLESRNKNLESQADNLLKENRQLKKQTNKLWFVSGAGVLLLGWILGLVMGRTQIRRRRNFIKVDL
ncbi:MAG: TIGR04211 family SH3 domain-containing protein [Syntrophales bacterium]|nr:TIGR04211 family SH3 domain-containing protein [Syntrophales bacterium]